MIFISYRVADVADLVSYLDASLTEVFGEAAVFRDKTRLQGGQDWPDELEKNARSRKIMLVVIGPKWRSVAFEKGDLKYFPRLSDPEDWVRKEISVSLKARNVVIPVFVNNTEKPEEGWLANCKLGGLYGKHGVNLRTNDYKTDLKNLIALLERHGVQRIDRPTGAVTSDHSEAVQSPRFAISRLPLVAAELIGRDDELRMLDEAWLGAGKKNILIIVAWGGTGKSSLVATWAAGKKQSSGQEIDRYFDWTFYDYGTRCYDDPSEKNIVASADLFVKEALEFFGDSDLTSDAVGEKKGARLAELVRTSRSLIILDGLEPLQDAQTGKLRSQALTTFLRGLAETNLGLCLITTRQSLPDPPHRPGTMISECVLSRLSAEAGGTLLNNLGVNGSPTEREALAEKVKGHALTLTLLGKFLSSAHAGDIRKCDDISLKDIDYEESSGHAFRVIEAYEKWFERDRQPDELAILRLLGLFDRPATPDCIDALRTGRPILGLTDELRGLSDAWWNYAIANLTKYGLIEEKGRQHVSITGYSEEEAKAAWNCIKQGTPLELGEPQPFRQNHWCHPESKSLDSHPLIREYFARSLRDEMPEAWRAANAILFDHLQSSVPYWPEGIDGLTPLYQSIAHGVQARRYDESFDVYWYRIQRDELAYGHRTLAAFDEELLALGTFFEQRFTQPISSFSPSRQALILGLTGSRLRSVGRFTDAIPVLEETIKRYQELAPREPKFEALRARHLSETFFAIGDFDSGLQRAAEAMASADASGDWYLSMAARCVYGALLHHRGDVARGDVDAAHAAFKDAENQLAANPLGLATLYSLWGFRYLELLLDEERYEEVRISVGKMAAAWNAGLPDRGPEQGLKPLGRMLERLAEACADLELDMRTESCPTVATVERLQQLSDELWNINRHDFRPYGQLAYAKCLRLAKKYAEAAAPLRKVWEMAASDEMKVFQAECWLECAQLYLDGGRRCEFQGFRNKLLGLESNAPFDEIELIDFIQTRYCRRKQRLQEIVAALDVADPNWRQGGS